MKPMNNVELRHVGMRLANARCILHLPVNERDAFVRDVECAPSWSEMSEKSRDLWVRAEDETNREYRKRVSLAV